ncbi:MAG: hypothetical protein KatS3mg115_1961 [Candidatus Poribacteria bacterium]|nr:MAG: hypothetical protein KatS3mg115_1961 [Candidatus Poribacteria bacterium]
MAKATRVELLKYLFALDEGAKRVLGVYFRIPEEEHPIVEVPTAFNFRLRGPVSNETLIWMIREVGDASPFEMATLFLVLLATHQGGTFLDIGAHLGYFSLAAACNTSAPLEVHAFEPVRFYNRLLRENIALNRQQRRITPYPFALSNADGEATIRVHGPYSTMEEGWLETFERAEEGQERITTRRLDTLFAGRELQSPVVVKIDVEGHEAAVLEGGVRFFTTQQVGAVFIEADAERTPRAQSALDRLEEWGFELYAIAPSVSQMGLISPVHRLPILPRSYVSVLQGQASNWLAIHPEHSPFESLEEIHLLYPLFISTRFMDDEELLRLSVHVRESLLKLRRQVTGSGTREKH